MCIFLFIERIFVFFIRKSNLEVNYISCISTIFSLEVCPRRILIVDFGTVKKSERASIRPWFASPSIGFSRSFTTSVFSQNNVSRHSIEVLLLPGFTETVIFMRGYCERTYPEIFAYSFISSHPVKAGFLMEYV